MVYQYIGKPFALHHINPALHRRLLIEASNLRIIPMHWPGPEMHANEEEDGDEVQYIKEEKAPPITIDETEDQDDVIFVSTSPAPPASLASSWDEEMGISNSMDLDSFSLGTPTSSCSSDLTHLSGGSNLGAAFCTISDSLDNSPTPSVTVNSSDLSSVSVSSDLSVVNDVKLSVPILGNLSLGAGSDLTVSDSSLTGSGLQLQNDLSSVGNVAAAADLNTISQVNDISLPSVSGTSTNLSSLAGVCASSGGLDDSKAAVGSSTPSFSFSSTTAFRPTTGPLDLRQQDKKSQWVKPVRKKKTRREFLSALSDFEDSSSSESSSDDDSDSQDNARLPLVASSSHPKNQTAGKVTNIPPVATATSCASDLTSWLDLRLSSSNNGDLLNSASTSQATTSSSSSATALETAMDLLSSLQQNLSSSSVIPPTHSLGAIPTTAAQASFSCNSDLTQTSGLTHKSDVTQSQSSVGLAVNSDKASMGNPGSLLRLCANSPSTTSSLQTSVSPQLTPAASSSSSSVSQTQPSVPQCPQTVNPQKQQQKQAGHPAGSSTASPAATTLDSLDKIVGDCQSILSGISVPFSGGSSSSSACSAASSSVSSTMDMAAEALLTLASSSLTQSSADSKSTDRGSKRPYPSSLSGLDSSSLPPRKRVLKHSTSYSPGLSSTGAAPVLDNAASTSMDQAGTSMLSSALLRSSSYPATTALPQGAQLLTNGDANLKQPATAICGGSGSSSSCSGNSSLSAAIATTSKAGQDSSVSGSGGVSSTAACSKCQTKEGERNSDGQECKLSVCCHGHAACGSCLLMQARMVLTGKQKESLKCIDGSCNSFYPDAELRNSLPSLIVDILHERLDQDFLEYLDILTTEGVTIGGSADSGSNLQNKQIKGLTRKNIDYAKSALHSLVTDTFSDKQRDQDEVGKATCTLTDLMSVMDGEVEAEKSCIRNSPSIDKEDQNDFPEHWTRMDNNKNLVEVVAVPLEPDSPEYVHVAVRFHEKMQFPATDITRIVRIQNPYLWKSYSLKKEQMIQENGGRMVKEDQLFHGTKLNTIDAICRRGFDWRFCGKHGTAYGQGCYFAGDSLYSNTYTDRGPPPPNGSVFLKSIMQVSANSSSSPVTDSSLQIPLSVFQPPPRNSLLQAHRASSSSSSSTCQGSSSNPSGSRSSIAVKKLLPLLKCGKTDKNAMLAHLLKLNTDRLRASVGSSFGSSRPGTSSQPSSQTSTSGNLMYGPSRSGSSSAHPSGPAASGSLLYGPGRTAPGSQPSMSMSSGGQAAQSQSASHHPHAASSSSSRHQHSHPQSSGQTMYHQRYSLLSGPHRSHSQPMSGGQSFQQGPNPGNQTLHSGQQAVHPPSGGPQGQGPNPGSAFVPLRKPPSYPGHSSKKFVARTSCFNSGSGMNKVSALMVRSSSAQSSLAGQGSSNLMMPVASYSTNLSVPPVVSLPGGSTQPLALLTANPSSSVQGSSYLLVASLPPPNPPLPPLASLPPPPPQLLTQPGALSAPKPPPWPSVTLGATPTGQALDLRKGASCPRYMFLAKVLTGMATGGQSDYRRPPPLDPMDPLGKCYDSCVDNIHTPRIWVIFDSTQAYPEYVIEYIVNGDMYR